MSMADKGDYVCLVEVTVSASIKNEGHVVWIVEVAVFASIKNKGHIVWIVEASASVPIKNRSLHAKIRNVLRKWQRQGELWLREGLAEKPNHFNASITRI